MKTFETPLTRIDATDVRLRSHSLRLTNVERRILEVTIQKSTPGEQGIQGPKGDRGPVGPEGPPGPPPAHEWKGTELRFENPDGSWGALVDLKGPKGDGQSLGPINVAALAAVLVEETNSYMPMGW